MYILIIVFATLPLIADDSDEFKFEGTSTGYYITKIIHWGKLEDSIGSDSLVIGDITKKTLKFQLFTVGDEGHVCQVDGIANKEGNYYLFKDGECVIKLYLMKDLIFMDATSKCHMFCGMRAHISNGIYNIKPLRKPSYECSKASTEVEKTICNSKEISGLDGEMAILYNFLYTKLDSQKKKEIQKEQKFWLKKRGTCLSSSQTEQSMTNSKSKVSQTREQIKDICLKETYLDRMWELRKKIIKKIF